jgi:plastocyanin
MSRATLVNTVAGAFSTVALLAATGCTPAGRLAHTPSAPAGRPASIEIVDTAFQPGDLSVAAGTEVRWTQSGKQPHSVTAADRSFDSSPECSLLVPANCLHEASAFSHVFSQPGTYRYYCRIHGTPGGIGMVGTVMVKAPT